MKCNELSENDENSVIIVTILSLYVAIGIRL